MTETELIHVHRGEPTELELAAILRAVSTVLARRGDDQRTVRVEHRRFQPPQSWAPAGPLVSASGPSRLVQQETFRG